MKWDTTELDALIVDLSNAPRRIQQEAPKVFEVAANKIKKSLRADAEGHDYLQSGFAAKVNYDRLGPMAYEIGFDDEGQGELANIAVYGSVNNAPIMSSPGMHALVEMPHILRHLGDEGEEAVL
jgi:hypothetical protein